MARPGRVQESSELDSPRPQLLMAPSPLALSPVSPHDPAPLLLLSATTPPPPSLCTEPWSPTTLFPHHVLPSLSPACRGRTWCWALGKRSRTRRKSWRKVARTTAGQARTERQSELSSAPRWARSVCALCSSSSASVCGRCSPEHLRGTDGARGISPERVAVTACIHDSDRASRDTGTERYQPRRTQKSHTGGQVDKR